MRINKNSLTLKIIFLFFITTSILGTCVSLFFLGFIEPSFDFDQYKLITAAENILDKNLGRLPYFVNSSTGADIFYWPYIFTPLLYSVALNFVSNLYDFYILIIFEFLFAVSIVIIFSKKLLTYLKFDLNKIIIYLFFIFLFLSPLFNQYFIGNKSTYRWCFIFSILSFYFLFNLLENNKIKNEGISIFLCGFFSSLSPISFISVGLPIFLAIQVNFLTQNFLLDIKNNLKRKFLNYSLFLFGSIIPIFFVFLYFYFYSNPNDFKNLFSLFFYYSDVSTPSTLSNFFLKYGYFVSSFLITSNIKVSFLPIFILSLFINLIFFHRLTINQKNLIRILAISFLIWLLLAIPFSTHMYATRMSILYPLFICSFINVFLIKFDDSRILNLFIFSSILIFFIQIFFQPIIKSYDIKILAIPASLVLVIFSSFLILIKSKINFFSKKNQYVNFLFYFLCAFFLFKVFYFKTLSFKNFFVYGLNNYNSHKSFIYNTDKYVHTVKSKLNKYVNEDDTVLTNKPYSDYFPNNSLQALYSYRIFFGGVMQKPADKIFIFYRDVNEITSFFDKKIKINSIIYFKGFYYKILQSEEIFYNDKFFYGEKTFFSDKDFIKPRTNVLKDKIEDYFHWRNENIR